jgi:protease-4
MRKRSWFFWFAFVALAFFTFLFASIYFVTRSFRGGSPRIGASSAVAIDLAHQYSEDPLYALGGPFFESDRLTFRDLLFAVARAREDDRVAKLFLHVRGTSLGWAQTSELRHALLDFKESGKPLVAFIEYASNRDYLLATAADEIYMHPRSVLDVRGVRAEVLFLRQALEKLGVEPEFERVGAYKDAPDMFLRDELSRESREALGELVGTIHRTLVDAMVEGRAMTSERAESLVADGPFTAEEAMELGLVDGLEYIDQVRKRLGPGETEAETVSIADYRRATSAASPFGAEARIALIYGIGPIVGGATSDDPFSGRVMGSDTIADAFEKAREDDSIDAVVFRIDSPGGSDVASDVIWREAMLTKEKKPVVVSMGDVAASGGYWIATASSAIVAEPTTITGSIGIYAGKFNLKGLYDKLGFSTDGVSSAANADFFSAGRSFTDEERERLQQILEDGYRAFLERVAAARGKTTEEVHEVAQGRVWSGRMAMEKGLVDELGGLRRSLQLAKEKAGFDPDARAVLVIYPEKRSFFEALLSSLTTTRTAPLLRPEDTLERSPVLSLLTSGSPLALMPYRIRIR